MCKIYKIKAICRNNNKWEKLNKKNIIIKISTGIIVEINDEKMLLTCYHGIKKAIKINIIQEEEEKIINKEELKMKHYSVELDLALLSIKNNNIIDENDNIIKKNILDIKKLDTKIYSNYKNIILKRNDIFKNIKENVKLEYIDMKIENYTSPYIYLPYIRCKIEKEKKINGESGNIIYNNEKIIGILSLMEKDIINIIPCISIKRFINEIIKKKKYEGLCKIVYTKNIDELNTKKEIIIDDNKINYNKGHKNINKKYRNRLYENDEIIEIDNKNIKNKKIYYEEIEREIYFNTYIALKYIDEEEINITIMRKNELKKIKILARTIESMTKITNREKYIDINGIIISELTNENIIELYNKRKEIRNILKEIENNPYTDINKKILYVREIRKERKEHYSLEECYSLEEEYILENINNKKVRNIEEIKKEIYKQENKECEINIRKGKKRIKIKEIIKKNKKIINK